jgi:hypothetical protein
MQDDPSAHKSRRDWLSFSIAALSLFISFAGWYGTSIIKRDDVRVTVGRAPNIYFQNGELAVWGDQELTFTNAGNRAAVITDVHGSLRRARPDDDMNSRCVEKGEFDLLALDIGIKSFVLKAGEISTFSKPVTGGPLLAKPFFAPREKGGPAIFNRRLYQPKAGDQFLACLDLTVVTPDSQIISWQKAFYKLTVDSSEGNPAELEAQLTGLFDKSRPILVVQESKGIGSIVKSFF